MKWLLAFFLLGLDAATKAGALHSLPPLAGRFYPFGGIPIFEVGGISCSFNLVTNTGAAWGLFQGHSSALFALRIAILAGLATYLFFSRASPLQKGLLGLIAIGASGNLLDSCLYGQVVDFVHFCFWGHTFPLFNLADAYICLAVLALCLWPERSSSRAASR